MIPFQLSIPLLAKFNSDDFGASDTLEFRLSNADVILCTLSACDPFLIQDIFEKMSLCQLAVPIIAQLEDKLVFHLWASRNIKKQWMMMMSSEESGRKKVQHWPFNADSDLCIS